MTKVVSRLLSVLMLMSASTLLQAHHSYAIFDNTKVVTVTGTVTKIEWVNPHAWLHVVITDANGEAITWKLECRSISELSRQGLRSTDFETGGTVTTDIWLARDGSHMGTVVRGTAVTGKKFGINMQSSPGGGPPTGSP